MVLSHGAEGGANLEALILAVPLVVLGVVFFVQKSAKPIVSVVLVLAGFAIGAGGLTFLSGDDHDDAEASPSEDAAFVGAVTGLCEARRVAPSDPAAADELFFDESHVPLHDLADKAGENDREAAARLLQTKQAVEARLESDEVDGDALEADLSELLEATVVALRAVGTEAPTC